MDLTPTLITTSGSDPKTVCINYILQLAVSFRHFSNTNQIAFRVSDSDIQITGDNATSHPPPVAPPTSTSEQDNRWTPTASEADSECIILDGDSDSDN